MQSTTVGKEIFRAAKQAQQLQDAGSGDPEVNERLDRLDLAELLRNKGSS